MRVIINKSQEKKLFESLLNEGNKAFGNEDELVTDYLDKHYGKVSVMGRNGFGEAQKNNAIFAKDINGQVDTNAQISKEDLFYRLQARFKKLFGDAKKRDNEIWSVLNKWMIS